MPISVIAFILIIILISFAFGGLVIKWNNDLKRQQINAKTQGNSLGTSELKGLIQEAMLDTVAPIEERLDLIEAHMRVLPESNQENEAPAQLESRDKDRVRD